MLKTTKKSKPSSSPRYGSFCFEGELSAGTERISFYYVDSVVDIQDTIVVMKVKNREIKVCGKKLKVTFYENRIAEIAGRVDRMELR